MLQSHMSEFTLRLATTLVPCKLELLFLSTKISFIGGGESPCKNYYVSVARTLIFLWCIVTELPFSSSFWNDGDLSFYVILNALSCIRFILLWFPLWNSKTNGYCIVILWKLLYYSLFFSFHERCKANKSIKLLAYFFTEISDMVIKFQISVNCYS